jgi:hypothetical protein
VPDWLIVVILVAVAYHGLTHRDKNGERPWVHLLFGSIALLFAIRILFVDILGWVQL